MVQFFRYHHQEYENGPEATLVFGGDATEADCQGGRVVLVGNCTAKLLSLIHISPSPRAGIWTTWTFPAGKRSALWGST